MDIERGCSDSVVFESGGQKGLIHEAPSSSVDKEGPWPHLLDRVLIDQMVVVFIQGAV
jgi:hypothetical protein